MSSVVPVEPVGAVHAAVAAGLLLASAGAETLLTQEQALKVVFPKSESVKAETRALSEDQRKMLEENKSNASQLGTSCF